MRDLEALALVQARILEEAGADVHRDPELEIVRMRAMTRAAQIVQHQVEDITGMRPSHCPADGNEFT